MDVMILGKITSVMHYGRYDFGQNNIRNVLRKALRKHYGRYAPALRAILRKIYAVKWSVLCHDSQVRH